MLENSPVIDRAWPDAHGAPGDRLTGYPDDVDAGDLFRHASGQVAAKWHAMANGLAALSGQDGITIHDQIGRQIQDMGLTFRVTGDDEERAWPLTPMPLIIGADEWSGIERGLIQRARLLEAVATDLYGAQDLVSQGHLPAAVVTGSPFFARNMVGLKPRGDHFLHVYAVDLARGPRGQWRVLGDRLRLANGIGYALENRLALSRGTGSLLSDLNTRRIAGFFGALRDGIAQDCARDRPRIALLSPGRFNQSYPEQAHLARYLGFPLVEGRDLTVSDNRLFVRTIAGPKRIDAVWRWLDTNALDPLSFDSRSAIGVPDLFDAWARGGLEMVNWPGVEVLESPALSAFLPRLFRKVLGEEPLLPNVATWWCGQPGEAAVVRRRIDELVVLAAFGRSVEALDGLQPVAGATITGAARDALFAAMQQRPMDFCAQEIVHLSTTPAMIGEGIVPRAFSLRVFVARNARGEWTVMPGGFARLSSTSELRTSLMGEGDLSADVCVVDDRPRPDHDFSALVGTPAIRRGGGILASQAADNLFWFARYCERAEMTARMVRTLLGSSIEVDSASGLRPDIAARMIQMLVRAGALDPDHADQPLTTICHSVLAERDLSGGVAALLRNIQNVGRSLRDRLASDLWRIASRPMTVPESDRTGALFRVTKDLIERFSALSGLVAEDMMRGPSWRFVDLGRRLERGLAICRITRELAHCNNEGATLSVLLDLCDSQITYRSRYLTGPLRDPVYDLVLLDPDNPRSLTFQLDAICTQLAALPTLQEDFMPERPLLEARALLAPLRSLAVGELTDELLAATETRLLVLSETISTRYFLQYEKTALQGPGSLLA